MVGVRILPGVNAVDLALYIPKSKTLIAADFHIGFEEALNKEGFLVPRFQFWELEKRLEAIFSRVGRVREFIINGDLKHEFGKISEQEWRETLKVIELIRRHSEKIILIRGNHDKILEPIAAKANISIVNSHFVEQGNILVIHGNKLPDKRVLEKVSSIIIGHEHPAVCLREEARVERFKCYLVGRWSGKNLIVMPSFNFVTEGTDITSETVISPFLLKGLPKFRVFVVGRKVLDFGEIRHITPKSL